MTCHLSGMPTPERSLATQTSHFFSPVSSSNFSNLSSSQILFSGCMVTALVVDTSQMLDQDEEVALELSTWIGGNEGFFSIWYHFILVGRMGGMAWVVYNCFGRGIIGRSIGISFWWACFFWGDLNGPVFAARLPLLPMLVDSWVNIPPVSITS